MSGHFLIVEARFYVDIAEAQLAGAKAALSASGASFEHVSVPGALEIPVAIAMAMASQQQFDLHRDARADQADPHAGIPAP